MIPITQYVNQDFFMSLVNELHFSGLMYMYTPWQKDFGKFISVWQDPIEMMFMGGEL